MDCKLDLSREIEDSLSVCIDHGLTGTLLRDLAMPLKIIHPDHSEVMGVGVVLLSSPHTTAAGKDLYTGPIVEEAALLSKSWAIIAKPEQAVTKRR